MIIVKNMTNESPIEPWQIRVDRETILGNPFIMEYEEQRDGVIEKYREWFNNHLLIESPIIKEELERISKIYKKHGRLELFCWCAPKKCHAEVIREYLTK